MNPTVLIMASGTEEHFMPLSIIKRPKQLLNLFSDITILCKTINSVLPLIEPTRIFIAANITQSNAIINELTFIPEKNVIILPSDKDTAAAIGYSSLFINCYYPDSEIILLNTQYLAIKDENSFCDTLMTAIKDVNRNNAIVSLGVKPNELNTGIYIFKFTTIINEYKEYLPNHFQILMEIQPYINAGLYGELLADEVSLFFEALEVVPIEYGIMEHSRLIKCIPDNIGCPDLNTYNTLEELSHQKIDETICRTNNLIDFSIKNNIR